MSGICYFICASGIRTHWIHYKDNGRMCSKGKDAEHCCWAAAIFSQLICLCVYVNKAELWFKIPDFHLLSGRFWPLRNSCHLTIYNKVGWASLWGFCCVFPWACYRNTWNHSTVTMLLPQSTHSRFNFCNPCSANLSESRWKWANSSRRLCSIWLFGV